MIVSQVTLKQKYVKSYKQFKCYDR